MEHHMDIHTGMEEDMDKSKVEEKERRWQDLQWQDHHWEEEEHLWMIGKDTKQEDMGIEIEFLYLDDVHKHPSWEKDH